MIGRFIPGGIITGSGRSSGYMLTHKPTKHEIDRRGFLACMAWAGTGLIWTVEAGRPSSQALGAPVHPSAFSFAQISDSHIGFNKPANTDVVATLRQAIAEINALPQPPDFILHTGDLTHLSKPEEFDTLAEVLKSAKTSKIFYVPGEHDILGDNGQRYRERFGQGSQGAGWFSFDQHGVHFIGLVNVADLKAGGLGSLGEEQLQWLAADLKGCTASTPIVVFAHIPLWAVYPAWGWGTDDGARALTLLKRFGSVTVLNGHIHQIMQKTEGHVSFHTARSTAFPQPEPGQAASPGPMKVPAGELSRMLGITNIQFIPGHHSLALTDSTLDSNSAASRDIHIDNFQFTPRELVIKAGTRLTWTNGDDVPHTVTSAAGKFGSDALDTGQTFSQAFHEPGRFPYFCKLHPMMTASVTVER